MAFSSIPAPFNDTDNYYHVNAVIILLNQSFVNFKFFKTKDTKTIDNDNDNHYHLLRSQQLMNQPNAQ